MVKVGSQDVVRDAHRMCNWGTQIGTFPVKSALQDELSNRIWHSYVAQYRHVIYRWKALELYFSVVWGTQMSFCVLARGVPVTTLSLLCTGLKLWCKTTRSFAVGTEIIVWSYWGPIYSYPCSFKLHKWGSVRGFREQGAREQNQPGAGSMGVKRPGAGRWWNHAGM